MKILITGANGFIGYNLVKSCLQKQYSLFLISRNNTNISTLNYRQCSIENIDTLTKEILEFNPDVVVHCAWDGGNSYIDIHNKKQFNNVLYGLKLLQILTPLKKVHFICLGSAAEYGDKSEIINEEILEQPINFYGISKLSFKELSYIFCKNNNILWTWVRPFYTYGPRDVSTRLIPKTIISCLKNEDIELNSCDSITDYLFIEDFISGLICIIEKKIEGVYNICSEKQFEIKTIIKTIHNLCGSKAKINFNKNLDRKKFPSFICGSNKKFINATKTWKPNTDLNNGLINTIAFYETLNNH